MNKLLSFKINPTQFFILKIILKNRIPQYLSEYIYEFLTKENILHLNYTLNNIPVKLCFKFNLCRRVKLSLIQLFSLMIIINILDRV